MLENISEKTVNAVDLVVGSIISRPLRYIVPGSETGCCRIVFTLNTRHYLTTVPMNERLSHRHDLSWAVYSVKRRSIIGAISQNEASYQHPDLYVDLPVDRDLILIPSSPYLLNGHPAVDSNVYRTDYRKHSYRYEIQVGSSSDASFIGDKWSYREGRLCFGNWFNNKPFRWSFNGAQLILPTVEGAPCCVLLDAVASTDFDVMVGDEVVAQFSRSRDGARWHNEDWRVDLPARLITSSSTTLVFRFSGGVWDNIDFNLRQEGLALSRVVVDLFNTHETTLNRKIAEMAWAANGTHSENGFYSFGNQIFDRQAQSEAVPQTAIAIAPFEFQLLEHYFAPHEQFWLSLQGIWLSLLNLGISPCVRPLDDLASSEGSESIVIGPLRYDVSTGETARCILNEGRWPANRCGVILSHDIPTLLLAGLPVDDRALGSFEYRELFDAKVVDGRKSNFWEMIVTVPDYWASQDLFIHDNGLIGRPQDCPGLLLASASAEDWLETGDPDSAVVLDRFCKLVVGPSPLLAGGIPCAVVFNGQTAVIAANDLRHFSSSGGNGIARGWPVMVGPERFLPEIAASLAINDIYASNIDSFSKKIRNLRSVAFGRPLRMRGGISTARLDFSIDGGEYN